MELEQQLHDALTPCKPAPALRAAVMARVSADLHATAGSGRRPNRFILFATMLAVAAAAAMLAVRLAGRPEPVAEVAAAPAPVPASTPASVSAVVPPVPQAVLSAPQAATRRSDVEKAIAAAPPFTVRVLALQNNASDPAGKTAVDSYYTALLDGLRNIPGLRLITPDSTGVAADAPANFQLTFQGAGTLPGNMFLIDLKAEATGRPRMSFQISGNVATNCAGAGTRDCGDPASMAAAQINVLREQLFPADPSRLQGLRARLLDVALDPRERLRALTDLSRAGPAGNSNAEDKVTLRDPGVVRGASDLVATASNPAERAQVWRTMRGVHSVELLPPMIGSLRNDPESSVRVEAVTTLAADFASDPRARAALEAAASGDSHPLVRALAQRALSGEPAWNEYIVTSLKDTARPASERLDALFRTVNQSGAPELRHLLVDADAIRAFTQLLSGTAELPAQMKLVLLSRAGSIEHPAITRLLLDRVASSEDPTVRRMLVNQLARRSDQPGVRVALEKMSVDDPDPRLRELAARVMKAPELPAVP